MNTHQSFEDIYNDTYNDVLKFIVFKCNNLDDVNDILQETYLELYKMMSKHEILDYKNYLLGIARNKLKKYYSLKQNMKKMFVSKQTEEKDFIEIVGSNFDLENHVFDQITKEGIWNYLIHKDSLTAKIFYLYYGEDVTIKEIATTLNLKESTIKNHLYRTLKELKELFKKEGIQHG